MNLEEKYLRGAIDMAISNYESGNGSIPADLTYELENGLSAQNRGEKTEIDAVKVTFFWTLEGDREETGDQEQPYKNKEIPMDDYFTIIAGDSISKLQSYVEGSLDIVTGQN